MVKTDYGVSTVQKLLFFEDVNATMIYPHLLEETVNGKAVRLTGCKLVSTNSVTSEE